MTRLGLAILVAAALAVGVGAVHAAKPSWYVRLLYPLEYEHIVTAHARNYELDPALLAAVIYEESRFDPSAESASGAIGLMQLTPETARGIALRTGGSRFELADLYDPELNVRYGSWYLRHLLEKYGELEPALAAYNAGQGNVDRWRREHGGEVQFPETREYVDAVQETRELYARAYPELSASPAGARRAHTFWSMRRIGQSITAPPKSSAPAAKTRAPERVS